MIIYCADKLTSNHEAVESSGVGNVMRLFAPSKLLVLIIIKKKITYIVCIF